MVGYKGLVIKAEDLGDIVEIGMLNNECPLCVVHPIVEIGDGNLCPPIVSIIDLHMPVHSNRAHMMRAL